MEEQGLKDEEHKPETTGEEEKTDRIGHRKETIRRRSLKVIPNVDLAKKKRLLKKNRAKVKMYWGIDIKR